MGWKGSDTRTVYFENMKIPKTNILGIPGKGFKQFLKTLTIGRISISALALGYAVGAYEIALKYSNEREAFNKKINQFHLKIVHFSEALWERLLAAILAPTWFHLGTENQPKCIQKGFRPIPG